MRQLAPVVTLCLFGAAYALGGEAKAVEDSIAALVRPLTLPFLWRSLADATAHGDPREAWEAAQLLLEATPGWADGHTVFAFRYALDGGDAVLPKAAREVAAFDRLRLSLRLLEDARAECGKREPQVLSDMAWLVELAVRNEPGIAAHLGTDPAVLADRYLEQAEALGAGRMVLEQRLYEVPRLCAAFLRAGDRERALAVLDEAIRRAGQQPDPALAHEWRSTLLAVRGDLRGDGEDAAGRELRKADARLQPLAPFLR